MHVVMTAKSMNDSGNRLSPASRLRIVVLGYLVRGPLGGLAWHHLQYVLGFARLGHDVYFVEDSDDYPACYDPARHVVGTDPSYGLEFTGQAFTRLGLGERWAYHDAHKTQWLGPCADAIRQILAEADLLVNVSGVNPLRPWFEEIPVRVLVDTDPVFTQVRHLTDPAARRSALGHTAFMTFGENIPGCRSGVPDDGLPWTATRQPIVLNVWPVSPSPAAGRFTTVMQWDSYPAREYAGRRFATKAESFMPYLDLPGRVGAVLELALGSAGAPRPLLEQKGWLLCDPLVVTRDPWTYQRYIRKSKAEFTVAKHGYVVSHSGWFSERSAAYLASGRPVITQDTGLAALLPTGRGLLTYTNPEEAVAAIEAVNRCYGQHCRAARDLAEAYLDARQVLPQLIDAAMKT
jgi:hypothetical protein